LNNIKIKANNSVYILCRREEIKLTTAVTLNTENKENKGLLILFCRLVYIYDHLPVSSYNYMDMK